MERIRVAELFTTAAIDVREVLDLGSGGGHVAVHLKDRLDLTLVDRSAGMLAVSQRLNPECAHRQGDMLTIRLGRQFDAVLVHDAVDYVTDAEDLRQLIGTAFAHCRPGGMAVFVPDYTAETFQAEEINAHIQINLMGVVNSIDAVLPGMLQRRRGGLVDDR